MKDEYDFSNARKNPYAKKLKKQITIKQYEVIIYWSETDNSFIAEVPELSGCVADGKTYHDVMKNAEIVINEWIETAKLLGRDIPQPKGRLMFA